MGLETIKYLLGHSSQENVQHYLRRDNHKINRLRHQLTKIEEELENSLKESNVENPAEHKVDIEATKVEVKHELRVPEEILLQLLDTHPQLAIALIQKGFGKQK